VLDEPSTVWFVTDRFIKGVGIHSVFAAGNLNPSATVLSSKLFGLRY
jgi:hypothetical protein